MIKEQAFKAALEKGYTFIQSVDDKSQYYLLVDVSHKHSGIMTFGNILTIDCLKDTENIAEGEEE